MTAFDDEVTVLRQALAVAFPSLDTGVGSVMRKVVDVFAERTVSTIVDRHLLDYQYDVDAMVGANLENFTAALGVPRHPAKRATGTLIFTRVSPAPAPILIQAGTQVATDEAAPVIIATRIPVILPKGSTSTTAPAEAVLPGSRGNVAANTLVRRVSPFEGISAVTNPSAFSGGEDLESDSSLRTRFKRSVFRNLAGTEAMLVGVALDHPNAVLVNVIGASKIRREQIQLIGGVATSTVKDARYIYPGKDVFGPNIDAGSILIPGLHYTFDNTVVPPKITRLDATIVPDGIYDLQFEYMPKAGRNVPASGITNRVDVFVSGEKAVAAAETLIFKTARTFNVIGSPAITAATNATPIVITTGTAHGLVTGDVVEIVGVLGNVAANGVWTVTVVDATHFSLANSVGSAAYTSGGTVLTPLVDPLNRNNFRRLDQTLPVSGSYFVPFGFAPVLDPAIGNTITIGADVYHEDGVTPDFYLVNDITQNGGHPRSFSGVEIIAGAANIASHNNATFAVAYAYNAVPREIEAALRLWRIVTTDVKVHAARKILLNLNFAVILLPGYSSAGVLPEMVARLSKLINNIGFDSVVQVSDLLSVASQVSGVDAVRFLTSADHGTVYALQEVTPAGALIRTFDNGGTPKRAVDIITGDNEVPILNSVALTVKAQNSFGTNA